MNREKWSTWSCWWKNTEIKSTIWTLLHNHDNKYKITDIFLLQISPSNLNSGVRFYGKAKSLQPEEITERVMKVLKAYDKITAEKVWYYINNSLYFQTPNLNLTRSYGAAVPMTFDAITQRVMLVLRLYDKINPEKVRKDLKYSVPLYICKINPVNIVNKACPFHKQITTKSWLQSTKSQIINRTF